MFRRSFGVSVVLGLIVACAVAAASSAPAYADAPPGRYAINSSQSLVTDLRTGLVWQQVPSAMQLDWNAAVTYCRDLSIGGMSGFRLPTLKELMTLVDPTRVKPAIDVKAFPNTAQAWFWTASNRASVGIASVSFETGGSGYFAATNQLFVRCVR